VVVDMCSLLLPVKLLMLLLVSMCGKYHCARWRWLLLLMSNFCCARTAATQQSASCICQPVTSRLPGHKRHYCTTAAACKHSCGHCTSSCLCCYRRAGCCCCSAAAAAAAGAAGTPRPPSSPACGSRHGMGLWAVGS
jgi:hypothetical protein